MSESKLFVLELEKNATFTRVLRELKLPALSHSSNNMLDVWYEKIQKSFEEYETKKKEILKTLKEETTLKKCSEFKIIPQPLIEVIDRVCVKNYSFSIQLPTYKSGAFRKFNIHICAPTHYTMAKIKKMIRLISMWFLFVNVFVDSGCSNEVDIYLYLIPNKKTLPDNNVIIDTEHVNTAFTTSCALKTNVHIFREEEWFRALIHESFHNLGLDFISMGDVQIKTQERRVNEAFHTSILDIRLYETYCEMWAEVINLLFYVFMNMSDNRRWKGEFFRLLKYEQAFSVLQCVKLLEHNRMSYETIDHRFKEMTPSFSYYILKCILSVHLDQFLHFCSTQFGEDEYSLQFRKTIPNLKKYTSMIINNHQSTKMKATTKMMENIKLTQSGVKNTLRMSLFEIV